MTIAELEEPYKTMAINNQIAQGNLRNESVYVRLSQIDGNFDFSNTPEGYTFWVKVSRGENPAWPHHLLDDAVESLLIPPIEPPTIESIYDKAVESLSNEGLVELTKKLAQACLKDILEKKASASSVVLQWPDVERKYLAAFPEHNLIVAISIFNWINANYNSPVRITRPDWAT